MSKVNSPKSPRGNPIPGSDAYYQQQQQKKQQHKQQAEAAKQHAEAARTVSSQVVIELPPPDESELQYLSETELSSPEYEPLEQLTAEEYYPDTDSDANMAV
ncbi:unnamed protein product [Ambrosiozyma monospora]|uniref:Unnamed protein product n=1 Tax=Ambrosiozyma monospora TaxID=43982 RepID=A0A9W6T8G4_AMBMO|nr:unnamed protein product [Ambrosiozyma monospora]